MIKEEIDYEVFINTEYIYPEIGFIKIKSNEPSHDFEYKSFLRLFRNNKWYKIPLRKKYSYSYDKYNEDITTRLLGYFIDDVHKMNLFIKTDDGFWDKNIDPDQITEEDRMRRILRYGK